MKRVVIHYLSGNAKRKPKAGDIMHRGGVAYVRVPRLAHWPDGRVRGHQVSNGRPLFDWKKVEPRADAAPGVQG